MRDSASFSAIDNIPAVGLVIPCYGQLDYLSAALTSIALQSVTPRQVIIVSDELSSNIYFAIDKSVWLPQLPKIQVVKAGKTGGASAARNEGLSKLTTHWAICLDADDALHPAYIEEALLLAQHDDVIIYPNFMRFGIEREEAHMPDKFDLLELCKANFMISPSMFPLSVWKKVRAKNGEGFCSALWSLGGYEDQLFFIECALNGVNGRHLSHPYIFYRRHNMSRTQQSIYHVNVSNIRTYMKNHLYRYYGFNMPMSPDLEFTHKVSR